ncbi:MAG: DUF1127 domain-containing protein [Rhodospirillales bacterium]|nr:DUF1127 domain-containing protein [Rhodospirillales bacterium]
MAAKLIDWNERMRRDLSILAFLRRAAMFWFSRARQRRALLRLDSRLLSDIGVDRPSARREGIKPFWRD